MIGGLRHSSIVVQIENVGANSYPSTAKFAPSRTPTSSMDEKSSSAAYRAKTSASPGSTPIPTRASSPRSSNSPAMANCSSPSFTPGLAYGSSGCGCDSDMAMSR